MFMDQIKERKRISKMKTENDLLERNKKKKETEKKFANPVECPFLFGSVILAHFPYVFVRN